MQTKFPTGDPPGFAIFQAGGRPSRNRHIALFNVVLICPPFFGSHPWTPLLPP
jgi:hypothetical protein